MKKLLLLLGMAFVLGVGLLTLSGVSEAGVFDDDDPVTYTVDNVTVDGNYVVLHGHFHNQTENFQRVLRLDIQYGITNEDGEPILMGREVEDNINLEIGGDDTPFTVRAENQNASIYKDSDCTGWRTECRITLDK